MRAIARLLGRFLFSLALVAGWSAFALALLLTLAERSGMLADLARAQLKQAAGTLPVALEGARVAWFDTRIDLLGVQIGDPVTGVRLERVELHWGLNAHAGFEIRGLVVRGGRARITSELVQALERHFGQGSSSGGAAAIPPLVVRELKLEVQSERWGGSATLGFVDLRMQGRAGAIEAEGALHPVRGELFLVYLHGALGADRHLTLETLATGLPLSQSYLPEGARAYQPHGTLALEGHVSADLHPEGHASGTLRLSLSDASLFVAQGTQRVDHLALEFDGRVEAADVGGALDPGAWECALRSSGKWEGHDFEGWGFLGPTLAAGARARGFVHVPALPLEPRLVDLLAGDPADHARLTSRWQAFTPAGEVELWAGFELPEPQPGTPATLAGLCFAAEARLDGKASLSYQGWPQAQGEHDAGFPLPLGELHGAAVFARDPRAKRPNLLGLVGLRGNSVCGSIQAQGLVHSHAIDDPPLKPGYGSSEFELHFQAEKLLNNAAFAEALRGLGMAVPAETTWRPYRPEGGTATISELRLVRKVDMPFAACDLALALDGTTLSWAELPLPLSNVHGQLAFRSDGKGERGLAARFDAALPSQDARLALGLRYQTDPREPRGAEGKSMDQLSCVEARVASLSLTGDEKQLLVQRFPDVKAALLRLAPKGLADVEIERVQAGAAAPALWRAEFAPRDVLLQPQSFKVNTSNVRGRVIVTVEESRDPAQPARTETALAPLMGVSLGIGRLAFAGRLPGDHLDLWAADIHLDDKNVRGALGEGANQFDMSGFGVLGPVDLSGKLLLAPSEAQGFELQARLHLRGNSFRTEPHDLVLEDMRGHLELAGGVLRAPELHARLGRTQVVLRNVEFRTSGGGFELGLELESRGLPLDREHLAGFMDEQTLAALLDEMKLEGRLDIEHGRIEIKGQSARDSQLVFRGDVLLQDASIQLGLPFVIRSARASIDRLLLEGGRLRAMAQVQGLEGTLAGREIAGARMLLTYVEPQLSIENLEADLEGGKLLSLGAGAQRSGTAFSILLEKPYVFQLALDLAGVDIGKLLRGMFDSDFAAKGSLDARLRLQGNTEDVLAVQGSGAVDVKESRLWSIPVFRELFSQIGLENTAVFDRMFANLNVRDGRLDLSDIAVHSDFVQLRGERGWVDGDGDMHFDLELRYSSVDKLGPVARLFYWIQNQLLSVSIRGDMARPSVVMKNPISALFGGGKHSRALPLPPFSPLPPRF
jgi:AsmA-like C-terminal region